MPNWCTNEIEIESESKEEMDSFIEFISGPLETQDLMSGEYERNMSEFHFDSILPMPKDAEDWYDWRCYNWGTKWEPSIVLFDRYGDCELSIEMETAWGPPSGIYQALLEKFPGLFIEWFYKEPGVQIAGWL
jgi:hypothetical protein